MSLIAGNLSVVQRLLDAHQLTWAVCAGAAAHLYGNRRPIQDVDILVGTGQLSNIVTLLQQQQKAVQYDGQRILWRGIKFFDDLAIKRDGQIFPYSFDQAMIERRRRMPLLGTSVHVLSPEDTLALKSVMNRGSEQGKHDLPDAAGIIRRQQLDRPYLRQRLQVMRADAGTFARLTELGVTFDESPNP